MSATPTEEQVLDATTAPEEEASVDATGDAGFGDEDLSIPEEVPTADDPGSRPDMKDLDTAGFSLDEFAVR